MAMTVIWMLIAIMFLAVFFTLLYYLNGKLGDGTSIIKRLLGGI